MKGCRGFRDSLWGSRDRVVAVWAKSTRLAPANGAGVWKCCSGGGRWGCYPQLLLSLPGLSCPARQQDPDGTTGRGSRGFTVETRNLTRSRPDKEALPHLCSPRCCSAAALQLAHLGIIYLHHL